MSLTHSELLLDYFKDELDKQTTKEFFESPESYFFMKPVEVITPINIIFNPPATIIMWSDGTKTVVKCHEEDTYDKKKGLALCYLKKFYCDNKSRKLNDILKYAGE